MGHKRWDTRGGTQEVGHKRWDTRGGTQEVEHKRWDTRGGAQEVEHKRWNTKGKGPNFFYIYIQERLEFLKEMLFINFKQL